MTKVSTEIGISLDDEDTKGIGPLFPLTCMGALPVAAGLRPTQVRAAMMLVEGRMAKEVAQHLHVSPETVSRWRSLPPFQLLMRDLLSESIDATKLGLLSLFSESIVHLRQIMSVINDDATQLKAISLLFSKAGPVLAAISGEVQRPVTRNSGQRRLQRRRPAVQSIERSVDGEGQNVPLVR